MSNKTSLQAGYKQTDLGEIPVDWDVNSLGKVARITMGQSPKSAFYNQSGNGLPLIQGNADIKNRKTIIRSFTSHITKRGYKGEIVMTVRAPVGEIGRVEFDCCLGRGVCGIHYKNNYLYHYLIHLEKYWERLSKGSTFDSVNSKEVRELEIILPSSDDEQKIIAQALSEIDSLITKLTHLIQKKRNIKQGAMQELLTGKRRLPGFSGEWKTRQLIEIANFYDNYRIPVTESKREEGTTPYYGANGIQGYIKGHTHDGEFVLIAEDGANDLNNYPVNYVKGKIWVNNHAHVIQGIDGCAKTRYLSYALKTVSFVQVLVGGTRAKLNGSVAKSMNILIPTDMFEQTALTQVLSDMDTEIESLEKQKAKYIDLKQGMMQQLLTGKIRLI